VFCLTFQTKKNTRGFSTSKEIFFPSLLFYFSAREVLPTWDKQIQSLCYQVNSIIEKISNAEPEWIAKVSDEQMVHWERSYDLLFLFAHGDIWYMWLNVYITSVLILVINFVLFQILLMWGMSRILWLLRYNTFCLKTTVAFLYWIVKSQWNEKICYVLNKTNVKKIDSSASISHINGHAKSKFMSSGYIFREPWIGYFKGSWNISWWAIWGQIFTRGKQVEFG